MSTKTLSKALDWALGQKAPIILASTTGKTAQDMLSLVEDRPVRLIVVTHEGPGAPKEWRFSSEVRERLLKAGHTVLSDETVFLTRIAVWFTRTFGLRVLEKHLAVLEEILGPGGQVSFKIARRAFRRGLIREGEIVVAVAGKISGADTALALKITGVRPFKVALLEIIVSPEEIGICG